MDDKKYWRRLKIQQRMRRCRRACFLKKSKTAGGTAEERTGSRRAPEAITEKKMKK